MDSLFTNFSIDSVSSNRIIYTPSTFARSSLIHLQETGTLQAIHPHKNKRSGLQSCLFFTVLNGEGKLIYEGSVYDLKVGDCVFIDCKKAYSHETGITVNNYDMIDSMMPTRGGSQTVDNANKNAGKGADENANKNLNIIANLAPSAQVYSKQKLWSLQWCHFYGPNMSAIYRKYQERGGKPVFQTQQLSSYCVILDELYDIASSADYVRDMRIHAKLSSLLILLMEDAWDADKRSEMNSDTIDIQKVKEYLDANFKEKITLDDLASRFYISKYYLLELYKEHYGVTVNAYLNQLRVTYIKKQLRFTDETVECIAEHLHIEPTYLSRLFKKMEGISPSKFRKAWKGTVTPASVHKRKFSSYKDNFDKAAQ